MKKLYILVAVCALTMSAFAGTKPVAFISEYASIEDIKDDDEKAAAEWFVNTYQGKFLHTSEITSARSLEDYDAVWVMIDREGLEINMAHLPSHVTTAMVHVKTFYENGGNVFLSNHATQYACTIGALPNNYWPNIFGSGVGVAGTDIWTAQPVIGDRQDIKYDRHEHAIYNDIPYQKYNEGLTPDWNHETFALIGPGHREDHNCMWDLNAFGLITTDTEPNIVAAFEKQNNCQILATWGHVHDYCCAGIIEFNAVENGRGICIANGLAAYEWKQNDRTNEYQDNIQKITENTLNYLISHDKIIIDKDESLNDGYANYNIIVSDEATLTCNTSIEVASLIVKLGGKVVVEGGKTLTVTGAFTAQSKDDVQPQIVTKGDGTIVYNSFRFVKRIKADRYYFFSLPFECSIADVTIDGVKNKYNVEWNICYYDGAGYAFGYSGNHWKVDFNTTIQANKGYCIGVAAETPDTYRDVVFTSRENNLYFGITNPVYLPVAANAGNASENTTQYKGWNFVKNPYMSNINGSNTTLSIPGVENIYVTIPDPGQNQAYSHKVLNDAGDLPPFFGFFVQVNEAGNVAFNAPAQSGLPASNLQAAPRKSQTAPLFVGIRLSNGIKNDETSLVISERYTEAYEIGSALMKMIGYGDKPQVYTYDASTQYAFHSLNEAAAAKAQPLGVYLPAAGEYTFSMKSVLGENDKEVQALYLYDYETNTSINLMQEDYTFQTSQKVNTEKRFALSAILSPSTTTSLVSNTEQTITVSQEGVLQMRIEGVAAGDCVRIFNVQGQVVQQFTTAETTTLATVPASGIYVVEVTTHAGVSVQKLMLK